TPTAIVSRTAKRLEVRIARLLGRSARMRDRAVDGGPDLLGVFPDIAGAVFGRARLPVLLAPRKFLGRDVDLDRAGLGVHRDHVAIAQQPDRPSDRRLRPHMADAEAARRAGETAVGDQGDLAAGALAVKRRRGREHLTHAGTALWPLVADDENVALL